MISNFISMAIMTPAFSHLLKKYYVGYDQISGWKELPIFKNKKRWEKKPRDLLLIPSEIQLPDMATH